VLLGADLWLGSGRISRFAPSDNFSASNPRIELYQRDPDLFRIMPQFLYTPSDPDPTSLMRNLGALYQLEVLDGFPSTELKLMRKFRRSGWTPAKLAMVGAKYFQTPKPIDLPNTELVHHDADFYVYRNDATLPRALLVLDSRVIADEDALFAAMSSPAFDPRRTVLFETDPDVISPTKNTPATTDSVRITEYGAQQVKIEVSSVPPAVLVLFDFFYPGWHATVNGERVPITRVDGIFRGLPLMPGTYDVTFTYKPASFYVGLYVALATIIVLVACYVITRFRRRAAVPGGQS
jgi:hypothetical protein